MKKWVELQVATKLGRLYTGGDAIELGVRVELGILHVGCTAAHVHGEEAHALRQQLRLRQLVFRDDD
jgi:hypothetical protein